MPPAAHEPIIETTCLFRAPTRASIGIGGASASALIFRQRPGLLFGSGMAPGSTCEEASPWPFSGGSQILYLRSGKLTLSLPDEPGRSIVSGQWLIALPGQAGLRCRVESDAELIWIECQPSLWLELFDQAEIDACQTKATLAGRRDADFVFRIQNATPELSSVCDSLARLPGDTARERLLIESKTLAWIDQVAARISTFPEIAEAEATRLESDPIHCAARYLEERLDAPHTLASICRAVHLNEFKLKQGFRATFDSTVFGYLRQKRMERARELLAGSRLSVIEIAASVGYSNPSHFARAFKQAFSVNPNDILKTRKP